jgi:hypothetical protein
MTVRGDHLCSYVLFLSASINETEPGQRIYFVSLCFLVFCHIQGKCSNGLLYVFTSSLSLSLTFSQIPCPENIVHGSSFEEDILPLVAFTTNVYTHAHLTTQTVCKSVCGKKRKKKRRTVYITRGSCEAHTQASLIVAFFCLCSSVPFDAFGEIKSLKNSGIRFYIIAHQLRCHLM